MNTLAFLYKYKKKNVKLATPTPAKVPTLAHQLALFDPIFRNLHLPSFQSVYLGTVSEGGPGKRLEVSSSGQVQILITP